MKNTATMPAEPTVATSAMPAEAEAAWAAAWAAVESLEEISKFFAKEYLGCKKISDISPEKKRNFINFVKLIGEIKDVLNH